VGFLHAGTITAGATSIIDVGSGSMADSDPVAVWVVDDSEHHHVLDEFVSTRETADRLIDEVMALCAYKHRWTMDVSRINAGPLRLVGVAAQNS
jgi:hypothetical protein